MSHLLAKFESVEIHVYRSGGDAGPAWLWVLVFAITGALLAVAVLLGVMLLRRAKARRAAGSGGAGRKSGRRSGAGR